MSMEVPHSGFISRALLSNQKFSAIVFSSPFLFPVQEGGVDVMIPQEDMEILFMFPFSSHGIIATVPSIALSSHSQFLVSAPSISLLSSLAGAFDLFVFSFLTFVLVHFGSVCDGPLSS